MIIFHEGLPRAGKTWEAMIVMAMPAIKSGRHVTTNIKGVNVEKIAEILQLTVGEVSDRVTLVPWSDSANIHKYAKNDGLIIFDEVQDFHSREYKLNPEQVEFITQHGQRGLDIVLCGQHMRNIHLYWRDRIQRNIYFKKMSALGMEGRYQWTLQERSGRDKFTDIASGTRKYDQSYYGVYKSHVDDVSNKGNLQDDRAVIWKKPAFKFGVPAFFAVLVASVWFTSGVFSGDVEISPEQGVEQSALSGGSSSVKPKDEKGVVTKVVDQAIQGGNGQTVRENVLATPEDYVLQLAQKYRPRMAAFIKGADGRVDGLIEFRDEGYNVREQLRVADLESFGWHFEDRGGYLLMTRSDAKTFIVTAWPVDSWGRVESQAATPLAAPLAALPSQSPGYDLPKVVTIPDTSGRPRLM